MTMAKKVMTTTAMGGRRSEGGGGVATPLRKHAVLRLTLALLAVALTTLVISGLRRPAPGGAADGHHRRLGRRNARKKRPRNKTGSSTPPLRNASIEHHIHFTSKMRKDMKKHAIGKFADPKSVTVKKIVDHGSIPPVERQGEKFHSDAAKMSVDHKSIPPVERPVEQLDSDAAKKPVDQESIPPVDSTVEQFDSDLANIPALAAFADQRTAVAKEGAGVAGAAAALSPGDDGPGPATVTVYLLGGHRLMGQEYSFFQTDDLARYGTGRIHYALKKKAPNVCRKGQAIPGVAPCLVVGPSNYYPASRRNCIYSQCRVMATNDERCGVNPGDPSLYGIRQYFSVTRPDQLYLPLGSRIDSWKSFQGHKAVAEAESGAPFAVLPATQRKFAFNAVFSKATNFRRKQLSEIIERYDGGAQSPPMPFYASIAKKWKPVANDPKNDLVDTDTYTAALLDSVFTLCPAGKNPEAFRLFEAVEAGSIPVMVRDEMMNTAPQRSANGRRPLLEGQRVHCEGSLSHWLEAPIVILESWDELFPTIEGLMRDVSALDEMQTSLREWYTKYMMDLVRVFEDYMLEPPSGDGKGGQE